MRIAEPPHLSAVGLRAPGRRRCSLKYLFWDQAPLPDQAAKDKDKAGRATMFMGALVAMKKLAEAQ